MHKKYQQMKINELSNSCPHVCVQERGMWGVGWSWELIFPFVQQPWKLLVFKTSLSSHTIHWLRERILCELRNLFILWCLWIFELYVCYALLILSLAWPMAAEQQLGHGILMLLWKKKENEASYSHISSRIIYMWHSGQKRPYPHWGPELYTFLHRPQQAQLQTPPEHALQSMQTLCMLGVLVCPQKHMQRLSHQTDYL